MMLVDDDDNIEEDEDGNIIELEEDNLNNNPEFFLKPLNSQCEYATTYHDLQTICEQASIKGRTPSKDVLFETLARIGKSFHPNEFTIQLEEISDFLIDKPTFLFTLTPRGYLYIYSDNVKTMYLTTFSGEVREYFIDRYDTVKYVRWSADGRYICIKMNNIRHMIDFETGTYYAGPKYCTEGFMDGIPGYLRFEVVKTSKLGRFVTVNLISELRPFQRHVLKLLDFLQQ